MKFALVVWVAAFSCCAQEAICRRAQVSTPLDALGKEAQVLGHSPISTLTKIYNAKKADAQDVALKISTASTVSRVLTKMYKANKADTQNVALKSNAASTVSQQQEQSSPTALIEGRHSDISQDDTISLDKDNEQQLNSMAPRKDRNSDVGKPAKISNDELDEEQSNSTALVEDRNSDAGKPTKISNDALDEEQSNSTALVEARHDHVSVGDPGKKSKAKRGSQEQSTLSNVMQSFPAHVPPAYWIVGGLLALFLCCFSCCLIEMVLKKEDVQKQLGAAMQVRRIKDGAPMMWLEEVARHKDVDEGGAGAGMPAKDNSGRRAGTPAKDNAGQLAGTAAKNSPGRSSQ